MLWITRTGIAKNPSMGDKTEESFSGTWRIALAGDVGILKEQHEQ